MWSDSTRYYHLALELQRFETARPRARDPQIEALRPIASVLSSRDFWHLQDHRRRLDPDGITPRPRLAAYLRAKLEDATIVAPGDLPTDIAAGDSLVCYRRDHGGAARARLYHWAPPDRGAALPVAGWLGAVLIGLREGQSAALPDRPDRPHRLHLLWTQPGPLPAPRPAIRPTAPAACRAR